MKKFEYQVYRAGFITEEKLSQMGKWGWQLQAIHVPELKYGAPNTYYFMRELPAKKRKKNDNASKGTRSRNSSK